MQKLLVVIIDFMAACHWLISLLLVAIPTVGGLLDANLGRHVPAALGFKKPGP
jgi:hypothetical protein